MTDSRCKPRERHEDSLQISLASNWYGDAVLDAAGARLLTVQLQGGQPTLWALVDPSRKMSIRHIILVGTGHEHDGDFFDYLGTVQTDTGLVWHAFECSPTRN